MQINFSLGREYNKLHSLPNQVRTGRIETMGFRRHIGIGFALVLSGTAMAQTPQGGGPPDRRVPETAPIPCLIEPHRLVKLATPVPGVLEQVMVDRGDIVAKGALIARLESAVEEADVAAAKVRSEDDSTIQQKEARRDYAESKRARLEQLRASSQYVARGTYEEAESDARQTRAEVQQAKTALRLNQIDLLHARAKLAQRSIFSPIDGMVTERNLSAGEYAFDQAPVITLAELDPLNVEAFLPIGQYGSLKPGSKMLVRPEAPIGGTYKATVAVIDRLLDSRSGTFGVRLLLANPGHVLPAGIRCEIVAALPE